MLLCSTRPDMTHVAARSLDTDTSVTLYSADPAPQPLLEVRTPVQQDNSKNRQNEGPEPAACTIPRLYLDSPVESIVLVRGSNMLLPLCGIQAGRPSLSPLLLPDESPVSVLLDGYREAERPAFPFPYILQSSFPSAA